MGTKQVTLPSGLTVTIRKLGPAGLAQVIGALPTVGANAVREIMSDDPVQAQKSMLANIRLVCSCVTEPRMSPEPDAKDGAQFIDDVLDHKDFTALVSAVSEFSALEEARKEANP